MQKLHRRDCSPQAPDGWNKWRWYGPGLLWMLSAVGTGSILFTPRVAAVYEYQLFWLLALVVYFMWVMIREMARYSIASGETMLEGMYSLKGPRGWAIWFIFVPQLLAACVGIAGLAGVVGSAVQSVAPGGGTLYGIVMIVLSTVFVTTGQYSVIEKFSRVMALLLMAVVIVAAVVVAPDITAMGKGLLPTWPEQPDLYIILPWVGTILAGSMGIVWFGYWTATRGFGGGLESRDPDDESKAERVSESDRHQQESVRLARAKEWVNVMSGAATLGVIGGFIVITAFMILGAELLAPTGNIPKGSDVAVDLASLFSDVWGSVGKYLLLAAIIIALGGSVLANQDGWGRSFADMTLILTRNQRDCESATRASRLAQWVSRSTGMTLFKRKNLKRLYVALITGVIPVGILLVFKDPVKVMSASGIIAALHTPFIALSALYVNLTRLAKPIRPGIVAVISMALAGLFYLGFAAVYVWDFVSGSGG
ncbi:Nramp family divalent metal transporter [Gilvimarinus sp. 1_MG-2023]|uniref:Nramp family divalent metal transporter n=1 Tax=Gilvimarinus sp. 1_MG-2023 TaxID=3062638 RepID=UPI0026E3A6DA|nr:Nramp family divalent metal transporter [Gilvimarinus sp. 1_MG-2023]MDO6746605.1 Nramp family divalent metal transporter [Gilvimarinus sp. 1_MG-2023]